LAARLVTSSVGPGTGVGRVSAATEKPITTKKAITDASASQRRFQ
jgi:hypothetical protein